MKSDECLYLIGLTLLKGVGDVLARNMLQYFGNAEDVFKAKKQLLTKVPGIGGFISQQIEDAKNDALKRAEKELTFIEKNKIKLFSITENDYPRRLRECPDAPIVFYYKGSANLDAQKVISIVGTRRATDYGKKLTEQFVADLSAAFPDLLVVSGLAYGIDVCSHRCSLKYNLSTVGVLAHGLDRIYPAQHRNTAVEMLHKNGGLLTDFPSETNPDRENFLQRNRLIAGLADATVVVESGEKGGALVTADIAFSYGRDVYTFPGRTTDEFSAGCNRLIQLNKAGLITSAKDLIMSLCWDINDAKKGTTQQKTIDFEKYSDNPIINILAERGEIQINDLAMELNKPVHVVSSMLFELEIGGIIKAMPGGVYKLD